MDAQPVDSRGVSEAQVKEGSAVAAARRRVLLSPFTNTHNPYIEMQKALFADIGYEVEPLSVRNLLRGGFAQLLDSRAILVFHWIELRAFDFRRPRVLPSFSGTFVFAFYCLLMALGRAKVVYFVHDHAVHDSAGRVRRWSMRLMSLVRRLADYRVVHAPGFEDHYDASYLPHPLYWDAPGYRTASVCDEKQGAGRQPLFSLLGSIRPYKQIASVLDVWPDGYRLHVSGPGSAAYVDTLAGIVAQRSLGSTVTIDARLLTDDEFEEKVGKSDVLILPHAADSMLVSGAFFEAIGRVPVLIARSTPFMKWAAQRFDGVLLFDRIEQLPELVRKVADAWPLGSHADARAQPLDEFGWQECRRRYRRFFDSVIAGRV